MKASQQQALLAGDAGAPAMHLHLRPAKKNDKGELE